MTWEIKIPFQDRSQTIAEVLGAGCDSALEGEDRNIATWLLLQATGFKNVGAFIDHVEALDADGRCELLDKARTAAGLDTVEDAKGHAAFISANRAAMLSRGSRPRFTIDPATMREVPLPWYAEELAAKEERERQILRDRDERRREEREERSRAQKARDAANAKLIPPEFLRPE